MTKLVIKVKSLPISFPVFPKNKAIGYFVNFNFHNFLLMHMQESQKIYSRVSNRREGRNKRGGWQISAKIINEEGAINREAGKNTAIRNLIEIKSSNNLVKISTKRT